MLASLAAFRFAHHRVVKELLGMKRPVVQLLLVLACGCVLLDKDFSRGMEREYFRRSLCIILTDYYGGNGNKSFKKKVRS